MGCISHRRKQTENAADQRWEYINLNDFKAKGCGTIFAYIYLWLMLIISIAVYAVDSFTAVNLLAFNRWSSGIDPAIDIDISKWIFSICIILSFLNLGYEAWRASKVIRRGNIAGSYLDGLAVRWESIRPGKGQGFRRFLVFAELTKSKKGAEYIALFTYFSFQSWIRVIICSGPRQVVNAFTIKAVYESKLAISSQSVEGSITGFFEKIKALAEENYREALTLSGMCFTLVIWVFSALFLILGLLFWLFFLWHWIPSSDDGLSGYCERKVTKALMKIVTKTVNKALARQEASRLRAESKEARKKGEKPPMNRVATLPTLPNISPAGDEKMPTMPTPVRSETMATLPPYTSRPNTPGGVEMNNMEKQRPAPSRAGTGMSTTSYSSRAPLVPGASDMGYGRSESPQPQMPNVDYDAYNQSRTTMNSTPGQYGPQQPLRPMLSTSSRSRFTETPGPMHENMAYPPPPRAPSARPMDSFSRSNESFRASPAPTLPRAPSARPMDNFAPPNESFRASPAPTLPRAPSARPMDNFAPPNEAWRSSPAPTLPRAPSARPMDNLPHPNESFRASPAPTLPRAPSARPMDSFTQSNESLYSATPAPRPREYEAYNPDDRMTQTPVENPYWNEPPRPLNPPARSATGPIPPRGPQYPPQRNMTAPLPSLSPVGEYGERSSMTSSVTSSVLPPMPTLADNNARGSPAPRVGPSPSPAPGPNGARAFSPQGYDTESQRGREYWNYDR